MSSTLFTSDTHFGHANVIRYSNRPFKDVQDMNEGMIKLWNETVKPDDVVWHLGDVGFMLDEPLRIILRRLNGHKNLILGNHDKKIQKRARDFIGPGLFETIQQYKEIRLDSTKIVLCHYAFRVWNCSHHGSINLHGHSHGSLPVLGRSVDVGVDAPFITGCAPYRPLDWSEVKAWAAKQKIAILDHHEENENH